MRQVTLLLLALAAATGCAPSKVDQQLVGTWELNVPSNSNVTINITNSSGQTVFTKTVPENAGNQAFTWNGIGSDGTQWPDGQYALTASTADGSGNSVAIATQVAGVVSGVNLTQTPPLLLINGQSFTVNQIQSISN